MFNVLKYVLTTELSFNILHLCFMITLVINMIIIHGDKHLCINLHCDNHIIL